MIFAFTDFAAANDFVDEELRRSITALVQGDVTLAATLMETTREAAVIRDRMYEEACR